MATKQQTQDLLSYIIWASHDLRNMVTSHSRDVTMRSSGYIMRSSGVKWVHRGQVGISKHLRCGSSMLTLRDQRDDI